MAKSMYVGVNDIAKKVKSTYVGVDGIARKVKKAYVGINGIARAVYSADLFNYYGTIDPLSVSRKDHSCSYTSNFSGSTKYALFAGGADTTFQSSTVYKDVDAYSKDLVHTNPTSLSSARKNCGSATVYKSNTGLYALFAGGETASSVSSTVNAYSPTLVRSSPSGLSGSRKYICGADNNKYALFAGGSNYTENTFYNIVYAYNSSLTRSIATSLATKKSCIIGCRVSNYTIFAGGNNGIDTNDAEAYSSSLVKSTLDSLYNSYDIGAAAETYSTEGKDYAIFASGATAYSKDLVRTKISVIGNTSGFQTFQSCSIDDIGGVYAIFYNSNYLYIYTTNLVKTHQDIGIYARNNNKINSIGRDLLIAGPNEVHVFTKSE